jgi:hypothetical protein
MRAFHNNTAIKARYLDWLRRYAAAAEEGERLGLGLSTAIGAGRECPQYTTYETVLGIPAWLGCLEDRLFEGMPLDQAKRWPERFLSAIEVGQDLKGIKKPFLQFVVADVKESARATEAAWTEWATSQAARAAEAAWTAWTASDATAAEAAASESAARAAAEEAAWEAWMMPDSAAWTVSDAVARTALAAAEEAAEALEWTARKVMAEAMASAVAQAMAEAVAVARTEAREASWMKFADKLIALIELGGNAG